jgi:flagellar biosynthesis regulator FlaF
MGTPAAMPDPDTVAWLLDCDDPSVRYFTLTLLGESADGVAAAKTRRRIMTEGAVPLILAAQREEGHRCERERFYTAKYTGTVWQLIILAQLSAYGGDEHLRRAREAILVRSRAGRRHKFGVWNIDS